MRQSMIWIAASFTLLALMMWPEFGFAHGMSDAEKSAAVQGGNIQYMWLGGTHMLSGFDHLAFVFGIVFFLTSLRDIAKYVTVFTLGHSATLIYATFNEIQLNYHLIDAVIALSVSYIGFANIDGFKKYLKINPPNMLLMVFGFGLIHGFGLSTRLQELPLNPDGLLLNIISFNVGIEFGQIIALAVMLLAIFAWRQSNAFKTFSLVVNFCLIVFGFFLFAVQLQGYTSGKDQTNIKSAETGAQKNEIQKKDAAPLEGVAADASNWRDTISITVPAQSGLEYKLLIEKGVTLEYAWETDGAELYFDFHGEPEGDTSGYFKSYSVDTKNKYSGKLVTPFSGVHGWYWKNTTDQPVSIRLNAKGDYKIINTNTP